MRTIILRSSYADIIVERETGNVIERDYTAMGGTNEWDDVPRFDPATLPDDDETDVLEIGFWTDAGAYVPALTWNEESECYVERDLNSEVQL